MTQLTKYKKIVFLLLLFGVVSCATHKNLSHFWRAPMESETKAEWRTVDYGRYVFAEGDFNGDSHKDEVKILIRKNSPVVGLFVFISDGAKGFETYLLGEFDSNGFLDTMGIKVVKAGRYKTVCGKDYFDCRNNEKTEIDIKHNAIELFKYDGPSSYFYWDKYENDFQRVWVSD